MNANSFDAIVLGGGTMGSAAAWALSRGGKKTLVLEQFGHIHERGSHGGKTRILRHAYAESPAYVPLVQRADELWHHLERETGNRIFIRCGGLEMAAPGHNHARDAKQSAVEHGLAFEWLTAAEGRTRWPMIAIPDDWDLFVDPQAGFVLTEPALQGMMGMAVRLGAVLHEHEPALDWGASDDGAWVRTETATYRAATLIIAAGAWAASVLSELDLPLQVRRKTLWWLAVDDPDLYAPERFPVFIADSDLGQIYGFPVINGLSLKIADHAGGQVTSADLIQPPAVDKESLNVRSLATSLFPGVTDRIVDRSVCLYTMTPDAHFVVDRHPSHGNVVVACGFSGHGFKFAPAIGELAARLADNPTEQTPPILSIDRLLPLDRLDPR